MSESFLTTSWDKYLIGAGLTNSVYHTEGYVKANIQSDSRAVAYIFKDGNSSYILPIVISRIPSESNLYDFESPYGYGGAVSNSKDNIFLKNAHDNLFIELQRNDIVCGFIRFSPFLDNHLLAAEPFKKYYDRSTICMDLTMSEEDIWLKQIHSKHRNTIRGAKKAGLTVCYDYEFKYIDDFIDIYASTMDRLSAVDDYYFSKDYYLNLRRSLGQNIFIAVVLLEGRVISATLMMTDDSHGHFHLSGSRKEFLKYGPNNLLLSETALHLKEKGLKKFHLGGGNEPGEDNSLYKFKKRFSNNLCEFWIGKIIVDEDEYQNICRRWEKINPDKKQQYQNYTLKYRC